MFDEEDRETGYALFVAIALAIFVSILTIGMAAGTAMGQLGKNPSADTVLPVAPAASAAVTAAATELMAKLYFESGKAEVPVDALTLLKPLLTAAQEKGGHWVVSGYHDASGDAAANAELAKQRAIAVRDLLVTAGADSAAIELPKPMEATGGTDPREARRVEVSLH